MKILYITPHLSTGGLPQYLVSCVERQLARGDEVHVVEWNNIAPIYRVHKDRLYKLLGSGLVDWPQGTQESVKLKDLSELVERVSPDRVHFEEFPEGFMPLEKISWLYSKYSITETTHDSGFSLEEKVTKPHRFEFVSTYHKELFKDYGVYSKIVPYTVGGKVRGSRKEGLRKLGLDPGYKHILNVGLFTPGKNQGEAFEIARQLWGEKVRFHFVGNQAPNFEDYWQPLNNNKPSNCILWGERKDVDSFYSCMDLLLFTSTSELMPLVPIEALSWSMPVLMYKDLRYKDRFEGKVEWLGSTQERKINQVRESLGLHSVSRKKEVILMGTYADSETKIEVLKNSLLNAKKTSLPICLVSHYKIPDEIFSLVDYFIYDKENILSEDYDVTYWYENNIVQIESSFDQNGSTYQPVAIMHSWVNGMNLLKDKFDLVHYMEADQVVDWDGYLNLVRPQLEKKPLAFFEFVVNERKWWCTNTFSFDLRAFSAVLPKVKSWQDYVAIEDKFKSAGKYIEKVFEVWLRRVVLDVFPKQDVSINKDELYRKLVPETNLIHRGAVSNHVRVHLGLTQTNTQVLFLVSLAGKSSDKKDAVKVLIDGEVLIENFLLPVGMLWGEFALDSKLLEVYINGKKSFTKDLTTEDVSDQSKFSFVFTEESGVKLKQRELDSLVDYEDLNCRVSFTGSPKVELRGSSTKDYLVRFIDKATKQDVFTSSISSGHWCVANRKYFTAWEIQVELENKLVYSYTFDVKDQKVLVSFGSKSLGDTLAWIPYVEEFAHKHSCHVSVSTFWNSLFKKEYPDIDFIEPGGVVQDVYASYEIGCLDDDMGIMHKEDWRTIPLQKVAADILGLDFKEIRPRVSVPELPRTQEKDYVSVSEFSTMQCKFWNLEHGWEELVSEIKSMDLQVMSVSKEKTRLKKVRRCNDKSMEETIRNIYYSKAFIGVGSGLSWLAWALGKPVVLVSGFSEAFCEFSESASVSRVLSTEVCHGCFNDVECYFDRGDWDWCPREADFACSKNITVSQVLTGLRRVLK